MTIDNKLKFDKHFDKLCKIAAQQLNVLYKFVGIFDIKKQILCLIHLYFQISTTVVLYDTTKLNIFKKDPYVLYSMIKSRSDRCGYTTLHIRRIRTIDPSHSWNSLPEIMY